MTGGYDRSDYILSKIIHGGMAQPPSARYVSLKLFNAFIPSRRVMPLAMV
jgi:hypothetical protein